MKLAVAHRMGWQPAQFWAATPYEWETMLHEAIEMSKPPEAKPIPAKDLAAMLRAAAAGGRR